MDLKCPKCGNTDEFAGHQRVYTDVVVNKHGEFERNPGDDKDADTVQIYEAENPYGPWTCVKCGETFDE